MVQCEIDTNINEYNFGNSFRVNHFIHMDQGPNWTLISWLVGGGAAIIAMLLSWIAFMIREDKIQNEKNYAMHDKRLAKNDKHHIRYDKKFAKQHSEIKGLIEILSQSNGIKKAGRL